MFVVKCGYQSNIVHRTKYADTSHYDGSRNLKARHREKGPPQTCLVHLPAVDLKRKVAASSVRRTPIKTAMPKLDHMIPHLAQRSMNFT
jgi:hypothetical protein